MLGAIIGDIAGSIYEFNNTKDYNFRMFNSQSDYTDDSVISLAVAQWLLTDPEHKYETLETAMVDFAMGCPNPMGGYGGGFQSWLFEPKHLYRYVNQDDTVPYVSKSGRHPYGSWGNGSAMRVSAVGWFFNTLEETERVAKISAEITHNHPEGIKGAQATAAAIWMARNNSKKADIKRYVEEKYGYDLNMTWKYLNDTYDWDSSCQGTVPQAIVCFLESKDFEDAIRMAVSIGGDSDTLACITGGIAEAYYGVIPKEMRAKTMECLPASYKKILEEMKQKSFYSLIAQPLT